MSVIYILLPVALLLGAIALIAFIRAVRAGQFDDLETPRWRVLTDDEVPRSQARESETPGSRVPDDSADAPADGDRGPR